MTTDQLTKYIPRYGDCLAAIAFAKQSLVLDDEPNSSFKRKSSLRDRLADKLYGKRKPDEHTRRSVPQEGNKNAKKLSKKIEIGWLHQYGSSGFHQVRSPSGGGTREITMNFDATMSQMLESVKILFFPGGQSKKGSASDFDFFITDQTHTKLENSMTIQQVYDSTKLKTLRFYMVTTPKIVDINMDVTQHGQKETVDKRVIESSIADIFATDRELKGSTNQQKPHETPTLLSLDSDEECDKASVSEQPSSSSRSSDNGGSVVPSTNVSPFVEHLSILRDDGQNSTDLFLDPDDYLEELSQTTHNYVEQPYSQAFEKPTCQIQLHRIKMHDELMQHFKNPEIMETDIKFIFIDEKGQDADGVSRDAYAGFWESFLLRNTDGETYRVPVLCNDYSQEEWEGIGRILYKGFKDHRYFPISLAPAFIVAVVHGEESVTPKLLKDSFFSYLSPSEKEVLISAADGLPVDEDELLCILDRFQCHKIPSTEEMSSTIIQIAHKILIQEPKYALDAIKSVSSCAFKVFLPYPEDVMALYEKLKPDIPKVLGLLKASPSTKEESASFGFLQRFVRGRNMKQLVKFLRLLTGSDVVCVEKIDVTFVVRYGKGRIPSIHTCGPTLELPSTYVNFPDFRTEWESIMDNQYSMEMSIA